MARTRATVTSRETLIVRALKHGGPPRWSPHPGFTGRPLQHDSSLEGDRGSDRLASRLDSRLSVRLAADKTWFMRLKLRTQSKIEAAPVGVDELASRALEASERGAPVLAVMKSKTGELRLLLYDGKAAAALIRPGEALSGKAALEAAREMPRGKAVIYILKAPLPK
ncbi:MAG: hypothetical protein GSR80_000334 [Desulfurococcales archaeon]|nr:hypothetical protein [Desulfurococcales archaeon]